VRVVITSTASRFSDAARFSVAHGGEDGHPFPVHIKVYDESIHVLQKGIERSKLGHADKLKTINKLHQLVIKTEEHFPPNFDVQQVIGQERTDSWKYGGRTVMGKAKRPLASPRSSQLSLF